MNMIFGFGIKVIKVFSESMTCCKNILNYDTILWQNETLSFQWSKIRVFCQRQFRVAISPETFIREE